MDMDFRPCRLDLRLPVGLDDRLHVRDSPRLLGVLPEVTARFQIAAEQQVGDVKQGLDPFPVEIQLVVLLLLPTSVVKEIPPATGQLVGGFRKGAPFKIDGVAQRIPVVCLQRSETGSEEIIAVVPELFRSAPPHFGEKVRGGVRVRDIHGRGFEVAIRKPAEDPKYLLVGMVRRVAKDFQPPVLLKGERIGVLIHRVFRKLVYDSQFQHPTPEVASHALVTDLRVEVLRLELLHLPEALLHGGRPDAVQQLIKIDVGERRGYGAVDAFAHLRTPREIAPQLPDVQVVVGREVAAEHPLPRRVVLIVLHELALPVEVPAFQLEGIVAVLVHPDHFVDPRRHVLIGLGGWGSGGAVRGLLHRVEHDSVPTPRLVSELLVMHLACERADILPGVFHDGKSTFFFGCWLLAFGFWLRWRSRAPLLFMQKFMSKDMRIYGLTRDSCEIGK